MQNGLQSLKFRMSVAACIKDIVAQVRRFVMNDTNHALYTLNYFTPLTSSETPDTINYLRHSQTMNA